MRIGKSRKPMDLRKQVQVRVPRNYPWRVLDQLIEDLRHSLDEDSVNEIKGIVRRKDFAAYTQLSEAWGPQSSTPSDILQKDKFFARYQVSCLLKKFQFPTDSKARRATALKKFADAENDCLRFNLFGARQLEFLEEEDELGAYTYARQFLSKLLGEELPEEQQLTFWSRHGPGANLDTVERRISLYDKYKGWPYSCTSGALRLARSAIEADERWLGALESSYREKHGIEPWRILDREVFWSSVLHVVPGNRITFVPKNAQTDRSIAIEPAMNLYLQLGIDGFIRRRLKRWGVDLDDQEKNQRLAGLGSKFWSGEDPFVTLDLAAASDTISLEVCRLLLPPQWYRHLIKLRSPVGVCNGEIVSYEKISSMGNGYTFALESAIFAALIYGVEKQLKGSFNREEIAVYGDDLIVRRSSAPLLIRMLNLCGFKLNSEKSFLDGPFRESCGADWLSGTLVRPVFLTQAPSTVMELFGDTNRLRRILSLRIMGFRFKVCELIESWVPESYRKKYVGPCSDEDFDSYIHVPYPVSRQKHWMWEYERLVVLPKRLRGDNFLFRKLMCALRPGPPLDERYSRRVWGGATITSAEGQFTVTRPNAVTVGRSPSLASIWQDEYNELMTLG